MDVAQINQEVQPRYGAFAETGSQREACGAAPAKAASAYAVDQGLYSEAQLTLVPPGGSLDLSRGCGNPTGFAGLRPRGDGRMAFWPPEVPPLAVLGTSCLPALPLGTASGELGRQV